MHPLLKVRLLTLSIFKLELLDMSFVVVVVKLLAMSG